MKTISSILAAFVVLSLSLHAQNPTHDPSAISLGSMTLKTNIFTLVNGKKKGCVVHNEIMIWRTATGVVEYQINVPSLYPGGDSAVNIDLIGTQEIFEQLSQAAVTEGVARGFAIAPMTTETKVWSSSCVQRTGAGIDTRFVSCSTDNCSRGYTISWQNGIASIAPTSTGACPTTNVAPAVIN